MKGDTSLRAEELCAVAAWLKERDRMKPPRRTFFVSDQRKQLHHSTVNLAHPSAFPALAFVGQREAWADEGGEFEYGDRAE